MNQDQKPEVPSYPRAESAVQGDSAPHSNRTPMYQAVNSARHERQTLIVQIEQKTDARLICFVCGNRTFINRDDTLGFVDLLHNLPRGGNLDLLLHTGGGDIDAAEKLVAMVRTTVGDGRFRVIVPDFAKSAGTLIALGADRIIMSDSSELGPIDPQVLLDDGHGGRRWHSVLSYLDAYREHSVALKANPDDVVAQMMLGKFQPATVKLFEAVKKRAKQVAEKHLQRWMFKTVPGNWTGIPAELMNLEKYPSHGQMIDAEDANQMGLLVTSLLPTSEQWRAYWNLYCLQRLAVKDSEKLFESGLASLPLEST